METPRTSLPAGLVLAGGHSVRMGQDKAAMLHPDGRPLARRAWDLLHAAGCEMVVLSLREDQAIPPGFEDITYLRVVRDPAGKRGGPLTGIVAAMQAHPAVDWLVIACDMPLLEVGTLTFLLDSVRPEDGFLAYQNDLSGEPEPLCAFYRSAVRELLENEITGHGRSLRTMLLEHHCRLLSVPSKGALDNTNTPRQWAAATAISEWQAELLEIWISPENIYRGRHEQGSLQRPAECVATIECVAGQGLRGDRYYGYKENFKGQVTFLAAETLDALRTHFGLPHLSAAVMRRNLIVRHVDLSEWVGRKFLYQGITFEGSEECKPCYWMDQAIAPGAEDFLKGNFQGGLRARILSSGTLRVASAQPV